MKSASTSSNISLADKLAYFFKLFLLRARGTRGAPIIPWSDIAEYEFFMAKYLPEDERKLADHKVLEIGYGARPWRLFALASMGVDIRGIDLDKPTYGYNPKRLLSVLSRNGFERFLKSLVRGVFFDQADIRQLSNECKAIGRELTLDESRLVVGNAADGHHFGPGSFTFAFSEDVFEHIPAETLPEVLSNLKKWLKKGSLLMVRPHIYTGISGGHDPDCYPHFVADGTAPESKAWAHLLDPDYKVNTFLNRLGLHDYIRLFSEHFEVLGTKQKYDSLGKDYLTDDLRRKLIPRYSEEELLTNQVLFVLRA